MSDIRCWTVLKVRKSSLHRNCRCRCLWKPYCWKCKHKSLPKGRDQHRKKGYTPSKYTHGPGSTAGRKQNRPGFQRQKIAHHNHSANDHWSITSLATLPFARSGPAVTVQGFRWGATDGCGNSICTQGSGGQCEDTSNSELVIYDANTARVMLRYYSLAPRANQDSDRHPHRTAGFPPHASGTHIELAEMILKR